MKKAFLFTFFLSISAFFSWGNAKITLGADRLDEFLSLLHNKRVALVANHTTCLSNTTHLLDTLFARGVNVRLVFAPEHGFRGNADAGEAVVDGKDPKTGVNVLSLYGNNKKPSAEALKNIDVVIFDIQDVGARFYTYISTMHYVMEACAENDKEFIVLDRPNPNDFVDGPLLQTPYRSFVGIHPIPILHGLTVGELAQMINGEGWLSGNLQCKLKVIPIVGWKHGEPYSLPIKPSPNLPNDQSIKLYPSLCFFEATKISVGRGTYFPFQVIGYPNSILGKFTFTPKSLEGFDKNPLQKDKLCYGLDLRHIVTDGGLSLEYLISFYKKMGQGASFFASPQFMDRLAGSSQLRKQVIAGISEKEIRQSWQLDLIKYKEIRKKYLLYPDKE